MTFTWITLIYLLAYLVRQTFEIRLDLLNTGFLRTHREKPPEYLADKMGMEQYRKAIRYNLESHRYLLAYRLFNIPIHWVFILAGYSAIDQWVRSFQFNGYISGLVFFGLYSLIGNILDLPFNVYHDFVLEEKYGFNRKTWKIFVVDMLKSTALSVLLGGLLLLSILWAMHATGTFWWIWATSIMILAQIIMMWLMPTVILPLFNKMTPLEGSLRSQIESLAAQAQFPARDILTMDGSKRSSHANAFFTGFGKAKRIVFFDTLIDQLKESEILSVLAHEMGHYTLGHIRRMMTRVIIGILVFFGLLAVIKNVDLVYPSLGFQHPSDYAILVIFSLIFQEVMVPFRYMFNQLSRKHEYEADAFSVNLTNDPESMIKSLEILHETNLAAPVTHPAYAAYHYSHPPHHVRLKAIRNLRSNTAENNLDQQ